MGLAVVDPLARFKECSFIHSRNIEGGLAFLKGSRDPDHAPFKGNCSPPGRTLQYSIHMPNFKSVALSVPEILKEFKICRQTDR